MVGAMSQPGYRPDTCELNSANHQVTDVPNGQGRSAEQIAGLIA
jgi:hypothetical protein